MPAKKERIPLPAGCSITAPAVHPKNWKQQSASCDQDWYIHYRFFDPVHCPGGRLRIVKGMNGTSSASGRRADTSRILKEDLALLQRGFNPITGAFADPTPEGHLNEHTPLLEALRIAQQSCAGSDYTQDDIRSMMYWIPLALARLRWDNLPVSEVRTKHVRTILDTCSKIKERVGEDGKHIYATWSNHKFNKYRAYLMILFSEIIELGGMDMNPCRDLRKKKQTKRLRPTLSRAERDHVNRHLKEKHYPFWRLLHIFFHSGARKSELMQVQGKHVDLENQVFIRLVKKDRGYREVRTTIKDIALPLWREAMAGCRPDDYLFAKGYVPGAKSIDPESICKNWKRLVKNPLGITADFYSIKHSNTTETARLAGDHAAAEQNAHKSTAMVRTIYDVDRPDRLHEQLKKVNNPF